MTDGRQKRASVGTDGEVPGAEETRWRSGFDASDEPAHVPPPRYLSGLSGMWMIVCVVITGIVVLVGIAIFASEYSEAGRFTEEMAKPGLALLAIVVLFVVAGVRTLRRRRRGDRRP